MAWKYYTIKKELQNILIKNNPKTSLQITAITVIALIKLIEKWKDVHIVNEYKFGSLV